MRALRAITEFRVRGVKTNIPFLTKLLTHREFFDNRGSHTGFIDQTPEILKYRPSDDRASKLLRFFGDRVVNGIELPNDVGKLPSPPEVPDLSLFGEPATPGWRQLLLRDGPKAFATAVRKHNGLLLMDTTWRDAHQSLLATRLRTQDITRIAPHTAVAFHNAYR